MTTVAGRLCGGADPRRGSADAHLRWKLSALGERFLEDGSQGDDVKELQRFLQGTGHFTHKDGPTGYFGPATTAAVKQWQGKYGLPQSGGFGAQSRATYVLCKRAELRLTREMRSADPELAARRAKAAAEAGLVDP